MDTLKVFISSTCYDLKIIRENLNKFVGSLGYKPILSEHGDVLYDPRIHTHTSCVSAVEEADILVLIIGGRYGGVAVPEALTAINYSDVLDMDISSMKTCSITQVEAIRAIQCSIPIYTFIKDDVWKDHERYEKNKKKKNKKADDGRPVTPRFSSIIKKDTAKYIFEFINLIRRRPTGNGIHPFKTTDDIQFHLSSQWSAYFHKLLVEQRQAKGLAADIKLLGLKRISFQGSRDTSGLGHKMKCAKKIRIMFTSGHTFLTAHRDDLRDCVRSGGAVRVLLAKPGSPFVKDVECLEGIGPEFGISKQISLSLVILKQLVSEANKAYSQQGGGSFFVEYGYYRTHLRMSLVIIDDRDCYAILCYSPKRTSEALALLFDTTGMPKDGAAQHIIEHFDAVFERLKSDGKIKQIKGHYVRS